jgi:DNA-binding XRE family transcriptional regulator
MLQDIQDYDRAKAAVERGEEEILPAHVVYALVDGENPVKVWREYRQLTQQQLAEAVGISAPFLAQIETGKRKGSINVMAGLAKTLLIALDDLIPNG